jgi:hypothetical protein
MDSQMIPAYSFEKFKARSHAQMDHFKKATAMMSAQ